MEQAGDTESLQESKRKLRRSRREKIIAGVCGGLAEYFDIDPFLVRLAFLLGALFLNGAGFVVYIILWILVPLESGPEVEINRKEKIKEFTGKFSEGVQNVASEIRENKSWWSKSRNILGLIFLLIGVVALINIIYPFSWINWRVFWPLLIILLGLLLIFKKRN